MGDPSFYLLERELSDDSRRIDQVSHADQSFIIGSRLESGLPTPVVFEVDDECGGHDVPTTFLPQPVMSRDFVGHLQGLGVANLETLPVEILTAPGETPLSGYVLVNVVGLVACADLSMSRYEEFDGMYDFDELVIDAARAAGQPLFRLAEAPDYIVISRALGEALDRKRFSDIKLVPLRSNR